MNKKGAELSLNTIIIAAIVVIVFVIIIVIVANLFRGIWQDSCKIADSSSLDSDKDGISNIGDACPCNPDTKCKLGEDKDQSCFKDEECKK